MCNKLFRSREVAQRTQPPGSFDLCTGAKFFLADILHTHVQGDQLRMRFQTIAWAGNWFDIPR